MIQIHKIVTIAITALFITCIVSAQTTGGVTKELKEMISKPAPEFTLKEVNGNDFSLFSLRGKYVTIVE